MKKVISFIFVAIVALCMTGCEDAFMTERYDFKTGEVFYRAEMLRENYASGSNEPFTLCWEIVNMIESLQTKEVENHV